MLTEFSNIYERNAWHPTIRSGAGSDPAELSRYLELLAAVIGREGVTSVADLGCGDWAFSSQVDWSTVDYVGVDVVPQIVEQLRERHGQPGIRFEHADLALDPLPPADLAIVKDVLQHWPTAVVFDFLAKLRTYPLVLVTNDTRILSRRSWAPWWFRDVVPANGDIAVGGYRPLRLRDAPFRVKAECIGAFDVRHEDFVYRKEVLLLRHSE